MQISARGAAFGLGGLVAVGSALALWAMFSTGSDPTEQDAVHPSGDPGLVAIERTIYEYRASWDPRSRERWIDSARARVDEISTGLALLLERRDHPMLADGMRLAAALGITGLRPSIARLAEGSDAELRAAAIEAADALEPWPADFLTALLETGEPAVQIAALHVVAMRDDRPWSEMLACLASEDEKVQEAVVEAVPEELPDEAVEALTELSERTDGGTAVAAIRALGRVRGGARVEALLSAFLGDADREVIVAALEALGDRGMALKDPTPVRELALDGTRNANVRCAAFHCLERCGGAGFDPEELVEALPGMEPWTRYFAARCLLRVRHAYGPVALIDLIEESGDAGELDPSALAADVSESSAVEVAARRLLAWLSSRGPNASRAEFEAAFADETSAWDGRQMPAAPAP